MSDETKDTMETEFKALLEKYNCEAVIGFSINSADQIGWSVNFREKKQIDAPKPS